MYSKDNLSKLPRIGELSPEAMTAFWAYDKAALADGAIPKKQMQTTTSTSASIRARRSKASVGHILHLQFET